MFILKRKDGKISNLQFAFMVIFIIIIGYIALKYTYDSLELGRKLFPENDNIKQFTLDIKQKPNEPWNYVYRGHEYMKIAEYNNALNDFNKAIDLNKINNNSIFYDDKVKALLALNKSNDALNTINSAIQCDPDKPHLNFIRAVVYDYQKEYLKSINDYTKFIDEANIKDFPNRITYALQRRAINYYQLDRKNDAITSLQQARKIDLLHN